MQRHPAPVKKVCPIPDYRHEEISSERNPDLVLDRIGK